VYRLLSQGHINATQAQAAAALWALL
jgi:hypothetical protein